MSWTQGQAYNFAGAIDNIGIKNLKILYAGYLAQTQFFCDNSY